MKKGTSALASTRLDARTVPSTLSTVVRFLYLGQKQLTSRRGLVSFNEDSRRPTAVTNEPVVFDKFIHKKLLVDLNRIIGAKKVAREEAGTSSSCSDRCS